MILEDYSKTFCKLKLVNSSLIEKRVILDEVCYREKGEKVQFETTIDLGK